MMQDGGEDETDYPNEALGNGCKKFKTSSLGLTSSWSSIKFEHSIGKAILFNSIILVFYMYA